MKNIIYMRYLKFICFFFAALFVLNITAKKPKDKNKYGVYMAGVSASFTDSLVYFTNIQYIDSAYIDGKGFLAGRSQYSVQLKDFLETKEGGKNRTCFMLFNLKKAKLQKELDKLRAKYNKGGSMLIKDVNPEFKFEKAENF